MQIDSRTRLQKNPPPILGGGFLLKLISGIQQAHKGIIGFFIGKQSRKLILHSQCLQTEVQSALLGKQVEAVTFTASGKAAVWEMWAALC